MGRFFAETGVDIGETGWVTETGEFIKCSPLDHDRVAEELTGKTVAEVEKLWVRIGAMNGKNILQFQGKLMTKAQIDALDDWGIITYMEKKRCQISKEFYDAYFGENQ